MERGLLYNYIIDYVIVQTLDAFPQIFKSLIGWSV